MLSREDCLALDRKDLLAPLRGDFDLPADVVYLDGNSLGARPVKARVRAQEVLDQEWGRGLIRSWNSAGWFDLPLRLGDRLAPLVGAGPGEMVVTDTTSVNLFKALAAALHIQAQSQSEAQTQTQSQARDASPHTEATAQAASAQSTPRRRVIVSERDNFPTDLYIAQGLTHWLDRGYTLRLVDSPEALPAAIDDDVAVVMLTHVNYRTGRLLDMAAVTALAHACGALTVWDLAHSAGSVPVDLTGSGADFAVGCTYKYLNGGPGSPAFIWVAPRHMQSFSHPLSGWWGHASPFSMESDFRQHSTIRSALCGTQPIVSLALVECGLEIFERTDMGAVRKKSLALTDLFISLIEARCATHPLTLVTPREHELRGSQVSIEFPHAYALMQALIGRGVIGDYREPDIMRFGFTPLYLRYVDVWDAVETIRCILDDHAYDPQATPGAVT
ncbi:kynureninase [Allopusillimonas ginsengisoli]|nr:kynureninase [Allopusillimonas ginsengisoli]